MTKKHFAVVGLNIFIIFFAVFYFYLPVEVGGQRPGNVPLLLITIGIMTVSASSLVLLLLALLAKKQYVRQQKDALIKFRHYIFLQVKRNFVARYRRSVLGVLWSLLNPLLTALVLTLVFSTIFRFDIPNFPVYLLSGQLIFNFFSESTTGAMGSIIGGAGIIKKIYVPKYIFPLTQILSSLINLFFFFIAFLLIYFFTGEPFRWTLLLAPIPILYIFVFSLGVGMILSSMAVFFRDLTYLYGVALTLLMFLTPLFYPVEMLPDNIFHLIHLNPLFHYVSYFRELALHGTIPGLWLNLICAGFAVAALCVGIFVTTSQQDKYILYI